MKLPIARCLSTTITAQQRHISTFRSYPLLKVKGHHQPLVPSRGLKLGWLLGPEPKQWSRDYWKRNAFYAACILIANLVYRAYMDYRQFSGTLVPDSFHMPHLKGQVDYAFKLHRLTWAEIELAKVKREKLVELFEKGEVKPEVKPEDK